MYTFEPLSELHNFLRKGFWIDQGRIGSIGLYTVRQCSRNSKTKCFFGLCLDLNEFLAHR